MTKKVIIAVLLKYMILPVIFVTVIESINSGSFVLYCQWVLSSPLSFFRAWVSISLIFGMLSILPEKWFAQIINSLFVLFIIIAGISRLKFAQRGEPLLPLDLLLSKEAINIAAYFNNLPSAVPVIILGGALLFIEIIIVRRFSMKMAKKSGYRFMIFSIILFVGLFYTGSLTPDIKNSIAKTIWDQSTYYQKHGFVLGTLANLQNISIYKPDGYSKIEIDKICTATNNQQNSNQIINNSMEPNIIIIMSEAFWDPTIMDKLTLPDELIKNFKSIYNEYTSGTVVVPVFGGGTVNTEFELLTGCSSRLVFSGGSAYSLFPKEPIESMISVLKKQAYECTAIHPYHSWFYKRDAVYDRLGFHSFINEKDMPGAERFGEFIADREVFKIILDKVISTSHKDFVFAVTMQNHGPYALAEEKSLTEKNISNIDADYFPLSEEASSILEAYIDKINESDKALQEIINKFKQIQEPTLILYLGDHLPLLGDNQKVYKEASYINVVDEYEKHIRAYGVPFIIWDNYLHEREKNLLFSANMLSAYLGNLAGIKDTAITKYLDRLMSKGERVFPDDIIINNRIEAREMLLDYKLMQYDVLFGERYCQTTND